MNIPAPSSQDPLSILNHQLDQLNEVYRKPEKIPNLKPALDVLESCSQTLQTQSEITQDPEIVLIKLENFRQLLEGDKTAQARVGAAIYGEMLIVIKKLERNLSGWKLGRKVKSTNGSNSNRKS